MAVEKTMVPSDVDVADAESVEIEVVNPDAVGVTTDDESVIIDFLEMWQNKSLALIMTPT